MREHVGRLELSDDVGHVSARGIIVRQLAILVRCEQHLGA